MQAKPLSRVWAMLIVAIMLVSVLPLNIFAASGGYNSAVGSEYYNVISERSWDIAPGVQETKIVLNNDQGTRRQVMHTAIIDVNNPFVKVIPGTKGMWPEEGNYGVQSTSTQALEAEKLGYGNVVVATNASLSWYTEAYYKANPHLIGEPLGYSVLDGQMYANSRFEEGKNGGGVQTIVVINYDNHPITGEPRPADIPKTWIRLATDPLTGWEEQAIPVLFGFLVKPDANGNPVNQYKENHGSDIASRTFVGVRADGSLVLAVSDGEQAPYSTGFTPFEMADYMIKMGCVIAANCDGGGSTTFCSQRPGEDLKVNCSLADGGERPTSNTFLVISTAPADGVFARATISSEYDYYTPGSSVSFSALGTDAVGTKVEIPADVEWAIKEPGMGTIQNGVFVSNGTEGKVTVQMLYNGNVMGQRSITIVTPDALSFEQPVVTIPFGKTAKIPVKATATIEGVKYEIGLGENDVSFTTSNPDLGYFSGLSFVAVSEANAPADLTSTVVATLNMGANPSVSVQLNLGKASEVLWDFEGGQEDIDIWNVINNRKNAEHWDYYLNLSLADRTNGQVHDGNYSMRLETNGLSSKASHSEQYAWIRLGVDGEAIVLENARTVGFWLYVPEDNIQCWVQGHYKTDSNGDGVFDTDNIVSMMESENVYYNIDESGWHYLSMDISAFSKIALQADKQYDKDPSDGMTGEKGEFFLALVFHKAINNKLWQENGSINGNYTYYIDNFTVDYSDAVEDRENPVFDKIYLDGTTPLVKRDYVITTSNILNLSAAVADKDYKLDADKNKVPLYNASGLNAASAKVYVDGVEVSSSFANGVLSANGIKVADGFHRVKFEICDNMGNKSVVIRVVKVESGVESSTINVVPDDPSLDRIPFGSVYYMNLEATQIETIDKVETIIDLNNVNHWELDHMELAEGFTATYSINEETNTATIVITRTGDNYDKGAATLAKLPVRILYFDTDIKTPGYTAETYWTTYSFWAQDMKMDVDMGLITHKDGFTSTFSNEEFHVDTEMYTSMANMDKAYFAAHGTTHVHTPVALADKAPTCAENGYSGRTFCEGCNSVVEWGSTIPATGHTFKVDVANKRLVCDCGRENVHTGLHVIDGKGYYTVEGVLTSGWLTINDVWYYFDAKSYSSVSTYFNGYVTYEFEADGKLVSGVWHKTADGIRYYEGPSYLRGGKDAMTWYTIDGNQYCIEKSGYVATGTRWVNDYARQDIYTWYTFDENGVLQGKWEYTGPAEWNGEHYYVVDGVSRAGMFYADGAYYYANFENYFAAIKNMERVCYFNNNYGLLPVSTYRFGYDGKMVDNDVYNLNGVLYFYVMGKISQGNGVFIYEDEEYTIQSDGQVLFTGFIKDASGQTLYYENGVQQEWIKNGVILDTDGEVRYYVDGVAVRAGLVRDAKGDYYYINSTLKAVKNCSYAISTKMTNGLLPAGTYQFDAEGKMINPPYVECATHTWRKWVVTTPATVTSVGVETRECKLCDVTETREIPKLECSHEWSAWTVTIPATYISAGEETRNCSVCGEIQTRELPKLVCAHAWGEWVVTKAATESVVGEETRLCKQCGASETRELPVVTNPAVKNGVIKDSDGNIRYYVDGVAVRAGLVKYNGHYYYINSTLKAVKNCKYAIGGQMTNGLLPAGEYQFDAEGKMINPPVDACDVHFWGEWVVAIPSTEVQAGSEKRVCHYCGAEEVRELPKLDPPVECQHNWGEWVVVTPATESAAGLESRTCAICGETQNREIPKIEKPVDPNVKNGLIKDSDGNLRYYVDDVAVRAGLIKHEGHYYYVNSTLKAVKNCKYAIGGHMTNGLLPAGEYQFDAEGKMINPPIPECTDHIWGAWVVVTPATESAAGSEKRNCQNCGISESREIPKLDAPVGCEHIWGEWSVTTPATETATGVETRTCSICGEAQTREIPKVEKPVDPNVKNGVIKDSDGNIRYYVNGVAVRAGLVQDAEGNYYYINSTLKAVKNCKYAFSAAMSNGLLPAGEYQFDAEGRLILD